MAERNGVYLFFSSGDRSSRIGSGLAQHWRYNTGARVSEREYELAYELVQTLLRAL